MNICREAGLITNTSIIVGYPKETPETIKETMTQLEELGIYPSTGFLLPLPETGMWNYAIENNHITDIDQYLTDITERQDFSLNMTKMTQEQMVAETTKGLQRLNSKFKNPLKDLIKTGANDAKLANQVKEKKNSQKAMIERNLNVTEELNYGKVSGTVK